MITLPPYQVELDLYHQVPVEDRWIFNKLHLAERLGYVCGPVGTYPPAGVYCVRPIMNLFGRGKGGFYKVDTSRHNQSNFIRNPDGYFWNEWFDGDWHWVQYINDIAVSYSTGVLERNILETNTVESVLPVEVAKAPELPDFLKGFSRYLLVEMKDDKIIEAAPRCMVGSPQQFIIDDYKTIDPDYDPQLEWGASTDWILKNDPHGPHKGWTWGEPTNRGPFYRNN